MSLRTVIFIDGQNFRKNLLEFAFRSSKPNVRYPEFRLDEKHFLWQQLFNAVIERFNESTHLQHTLVRAYWYTAETITPFQSHPRLIERIVETYGTEIPELTPYMVEAKARSWWERERDYFSNTRSTIFEAIQRRTDFLEFKYVGQYVVRPLEVHRLHRGPNGEVVYLGKRIGEKGVDVGIAVDMIAKVKDYDAGILISGDADYMPAIAYIKDQLKYFYQFSLAKGIPPSIRHLSPWLRGVVDSFQYFDEVALLTGFLDRQSGIPPYILEAIDQHAEDLQSGVAMNQ